MSAKNAAPVMERAKTLGFELCGVARPAEFPELARAADWLEQGYAGEMRYLADPRREHLESVLPGVRSIIVCGLNYNTALPLSTEAARDADEPRGWISRYAWGGDYHEVVREKLEQLRSALHEIFPGEFETRVYVDTGPVPERVLAKYAGLGWIGKNTLVLNQRIGSYFFLGVVLTTLELETYLDRAEEPPRDLCGSCRRCIEACPTEALIEPYVMDARRCISYLTIELRGSIPEEFRAKMGHHVFGCDICQDVCPWNRKAPASAEAVFQPRALKPSGGAEARDGAKADSLYRPALERLASMTEEEFRENFRGSPVKRTKWRGLVRNACIALGNAARSSEAADRGRICALLERLSGSTDEAIAESAEWALSRIQDGGRGE
ncbi:MAG TPA: tRNA epoxyqueuosine(34) reductase QueG [Candidatus Acidoferrales bacterium]|nr:tRNA epoxyqueuosine(34) reductase QueG [Candidatus Acidoferrales bacterium]